MQLARCSASTIKVFLAWGRDHLQNAKSFRFRQNAIRIIQPEAGEIESIYTSIVSDMPVACCSGARLHRGSLSEKS